jgi:hypothetical protein
LYRFHPYGFLFLFLALAPLLIEAQETEYDSLLQRIDTVENPVYKPVISLSYGVLNFRGDVRNPLINPVTGNQAGMVNVATFVDRKHFFVANFNFLIGSLTASERSHTDLARNLNFETQLSSIGLNLEYRFGHLINQNSLIRPYLFAGIESVNFSSKGDMVDATGATYYYWSDGTIRDVPDPGGTGLPVVSNPLYRDHEYETDLRLRESTEFGLGAYDQRSLAFPVGMGLHFLIGRRSFLSLGVSYHYTLTDYLDNVAQEGTSVQGKKGNDSYVYSHLSLHFDLFSDPATRTVDLLFADVEFDPLFFDDEDGDFVLDVTDRCPGTPSGVEVDTLGCPLDMDGDRVPDYLDREPGTAAGAWVDKQGVTVTEEQFYAAIESRSAAMPREDVEAYLALVRSEYRLTSSLPIPDKFKSLDEDNDQYISFDELLKTVDLYFDYQLELNIDELRDLNELFFSQ